MKKRFLTGAALVALGGLAVAGLASCGESGPYEFPTPAAWSEPKVEDYNATCTDGGKVVNIRVWNTEFIGLFKAYYPGVEEVKPNVQYKVGDITVNFIETANKDNAYQIALDNAFDKQATAAADDKIDVFLMEADYALKYVNSVL